MYSSCSSVLQLETLDERLVPSVTVLDLTSRGEEAVTPSGAIVRQGAPPGDYGQYCRGQNGNLDSFLRIDRSGVEQGYNTDSRRHQLDQQRGTQSLTLGQVPLVWVDGVEYREFVLSINESWWASRLSLDELRIYLGETGNLRGYDSRTNELASHSAVFDLDEGGDVSVLLRDRLGRHQEPDMVLLIPESAFAGADPDTFVYLYSQFGGLRGAGASGGAEVWSVRRDFAPSLPVESGSISGFVQLFTSTTQDGEYRSDIEGAVIHLQGFNDKDEWVDLIDVTDAAGAYSFANLRAGTYTVWEEQPFMDWQAPDPMNPYIDGNDFLGTIEGADDSSRRGSFDPGNEIDMFMDIQLGAGQHGVNYIFTEILP